MSLSPKQLYKKLRFKSFRSTAHGLAEDQSELIIEGDLLYKLGSEALPRFGQPYVINMEFLRFFLRPDFMKNENSDTLTFHQQRVTPSANEDQKHCPDLVSHASSIWNFCACSSGLIFMGNENSETLTFQKRQQVRGIL